MKASTWKSPAPAVKRSTCLPAESCRTFPFQMCGNCGMSVRTGCPYDASQLACQITGKAKGYYDSCDVTARQKLVRLLSGKCLDTPSDVERVADWLLSSGVSVLW